MLMTSQNLPCNHSVTNHCAEHYSDDFGHFDSADFDLCLYSIDFFDTCNHFPDYIYVFYLSANFHPYTHDELCDKSTVFLYDTSADFVLFSDWSSLHDRDEYLRDYGQRAAHNGAFSAASRATCP